MCSHEWTAQTLTPDPERQEPQARVIRDAVGNELRNGDSVTVIKDLKIRGASSSVKAGTKVRNIRLIEAVDGHDIACKIDGVGAVNLKSEFVKKA
jgi:protein PhnA